MHQWWEDRWQLNERGVGCGRVEFRVDHTAAANRIQETVGGGGCVETGRIRYHSCRVCQVSTGGDHARGKLNPVWGSGSSNAGRRRRRNPTRGCCDPFTSASDRGQNGRLTARWHSSVGLTETKKLIWERRFWYGGIFKVRHPPPAPRFLKQIFFVSKQVGPRAVCGPLYI